ncbi:CBM96 family carbohydrate-binding protein [Paenibacillus puerhi]|uniref:CBM96 family carbohydrate-binding protein n=1 Tax=Paenibacillus puerhi TaxID=2692622 RepID=UPI001359B8E7|nr:DNRLRE domain-containing protein [Paenibacillus puerhi]
MKKTRLRFFRSIGMCIAAALLLAVSVLSTGGQPAQAAESSWWPDGSDVASDARAVWVYYSKEYDVNYNTDQKALDAVTDMRNKNIDVIIASVTAADMEGLSNPAAPRTARLQLMINQAKSYGMVVYIGYWEDAWVADNHQNNRYTMVDHVINFNNQNGSNTDVVGVVTDYEMNCKTVEVEGVKQTDCSARAKDKYESWRLFHHNLKNRIGANPLKLLVTIPDPDSFIRSCVDCDAAWLANQGITTNNNGSTYKGDVAYFSSYNGVTFADALVGMYYRANANQIRDAAHDDVVESNGMAKPVPIVVGFSAGHNTTTDPTLTTVQAVLDTVQAIEDERAAYPKVVLGTMAWRWDKTETPEGEYRELMPSTPPGTNIPIHYYASEDAFVRSGTFASTNYGSEPLLEIKDGPNTTGGADVDRIAYVKVNAGAYPGTSVTSAKLHFFVGTAVSDSSVPFVPITVQGLTDDSWSEQTVTWSTRPSSSGATTLGTVQVSGAGWYSLDVTAYVNSQMADKTLTFRLSDEATKDRLVRLWSREYGINEPYVSFN